MGKEYHYHIPTACLAGALLSASKTGTQTMKDLATKSGSHQLPSLNDSRTRKRQPARPLAAAAAAPDFSLPPVASPVRASAASREEPRMTPRAHTHAAAIAAAHSSVYPSSPQSPARPSPRSWQAAPGRPVRVSDTIASPRSSFYHQQEQRKALAAPAVPAPPAAAAPTTPAPPARPAEPALRTNSFRRAVPQPERPSAAFAPAPPVAEAPSPGPKFQRPSPPSAGAQPRTPVKPSRPSRTGEQVARAAPAEAGAAVDPKAVAALGAAIEEARLVFLGATIMHQRQAASLFQVCRPLV